MKLIIAGSRDMHVNHTIITALLHINGLMTIHSDWGSCEITEVLCGMADGIDSCGEAWAKVWEVPVSYYKADWETKGKSAGPIRNKEMAKNGEVLLLIWDGISPGSKNMKDEMLKLKKPVYEVILRTHNV